MSRIDLATSESAIASAPGVRDVAVRTDGGQRLVAHVVLDGAADVSDAADVSEAAIRDAVGALAPSAVPHRIVRHERATDAGERQGRPAAALRLKAHGASPRVRLPR